MAYCITSTGHEIGFECFSKSQVDMLIDPVRYFFNYYGLERHAIAFLFEQVDIECVLMAEDHDLDFFGFTPLERKYFFEFQRDLEDYYV